MTPRTQPSNVLERHVQTIIMAVIMALVAWVGYSIVELQRAQERFTVQQENTNDRLTDLRQSTNDFYRRSEALSDGKMLLDQIRNNASTLTKIEERLRAVEMRRP